jgi:hypothetical protein
MIKKALTENCTDRIELLFLTFFKEIFNQFSMDQPSKEECRIILSKDFKYIVKKLSIFSKLKHRGKYGLLGESLQRKLNLKLLILDILNQSVRKKRLIVQEVVNENDKLLEEKQHSDFKNNIVLKLLNDHQKVDKNLEQFLKKAENLYIQQKIKTRDRISDRYSFEQKLSELEEIYKKYLAKLIQENGKYTTNKSRLIVANQSNTKTH